MDKILLGIAASTHSEAVKRAIIERVINSAGKGHPEDLVKAILDISSHWITDNDSEFLQQIGRQLFHAWAKHNQTIFEEFFNHQFLVRILGLEILHPERMVHFVHDGLKMLQNRATAVKIVQMQVVALVKKHRDLVTLVEVSHLLLAFPDCLPKGTAAGLLCISAVENVGALEVAPSEATMKANLEGMIHISALLHHIWHDNMVTVLPSLAAVFNLISTLPSSDRPSPSVALGALVQHVPVELIATITKNAASDMSIVDERMTTALTRMIEWLSWPRVQNIDRWIVSFLKNLALAQKFTILINVTLASVKKVFVKLCFPIVRDSALPVLTHMQLSFQHSPEAFHKIVAHVPELMKRLKTENSASSQDCTQKVAELMYCLMYHHAGYPDLYEPVLDALKDIPRPSEEAMKETLKLSAWTSRAPVNSAFATRFLPRSETGKTGLVNLGNTCYMNSVLQALFMTSGFHEAIMACPVYNDQCVVARLQTVFAFLTHTQRAAYSPREFLIASRPPWFSPGTQQDCSEFLKYLLDRLDEEEKSIRKFEAGLQRTREWVEHMKRKNAKKMEEEAGRMSSEEGEVGRRRIGGETDMEGCGRLGVESSTEMDTSSNEIATKEEASKIEMEDKTEKRKMIPERGEKQPKGCDEVVMETSVSSPTIDASTISLSPCIISEQGHSVCTPKPEDNSAATKLVAVKLSGIQSDQASGDTKIKFLDRNTTSEPPIGPSIVEEYFSGKSVTRIRCLTCNSVSSRTEAFFDLPLAFPGSDTTSSMRGGESCTNKDDASKSLGLAADRLAQEELASGSKQWELNGGAAASTSAIKDLMSGPGQSGEGSNSSTAPPSSLEELLVHYLNPELLTGDNQYHCEKCRCLRDAEKRIEISKAPKVLMLTLMRFSYDVKTQSRCKILADVRFPKILNLVLNHPERDNGDKANTEADKVSDEQDLSQDPPCSKRLRQNSENLTTSNDEETKHRFALYGVIVHSGLSSESGHYYCYARHSNFSPDSQRKSKPSKIKTECESGDSKMQDLLPEDVEEDLLPDQWFLFNDSRVSFSSYDSFGNVTKRFPKDTAYVLFYRQVPEESNEQSGCQTGSDTSPVELREKPLKKNLQERVKKDNAQYLKERELEARTMALRTSQGLENFSSNRRDFDDRNDPPSGCGGGGGMEPPRLVF
ncbi:ubiquitin carboxyl-terminal hydrolase 38-like [Patiria miniata]|uniref:USP domain-containing protein n=1 Tax=Patiria miniata TaxID=46514 RepID=A0A913ZW40_PATMI|nr:ubiquitin carboxyl-terminal hydrolase 38-like [Patiria miniata]